MDGRDRNPLHVLVVAVSSEQRNRLRVILDQATAAHISTSAAVSLARAGEIHADLIFVDVDGPAIAKAVIRTAEALPEGTGVITLADNPDPQWVRQALQAGVNAILSREATSEEVRLAILAAEAGLVLLHPSSAQHLSREGLASQDASIFAEALTAREREVLRLVGEGLGNKEIAARLNISGHTVKFHISSVLGKLGATSRTEAVSQGIRRGLIAM